MSTQQALIAVEPPAGEAQAALIERLATNPDVSVEKLERLMALWEQAEDRRARTAFHAAMADAQKAMRPVAADADNPQTRSRYASYAALDRALRPLYTEHGFGLSFNTADAPGELMIRIVCDVSHVGGYAKVYHIDMPADGKGARGGDVMTRTHATGSAVSYGMRYLLKMIWNVAVGAERDDDGNAVAGPRADAAPVEGMAAFLATLEAAAVAGMPALSKAVNAGAPGLRTALLRTYADQWEKLKAVAVAAGKAGAK